MRHYGKPDRRYRPVTKEDTMPERSGHPKPERPDYPRRQKDEAAVTLASLGWDFERREAQSKAMKGNKRAVGHTPWNKGKSKKDDIRLQHIGSVAKWQVQIQSKTRTAC